MNSKKRVVGRRAVIQSVLGVAAGITGLSRAEAQTKTVRTSTAPPHPVVETTSGKVLGFSNRGVSVFLGVPYGASTWGPNRFLPPRKPEPWAGLRDCLNYGHACPELSARPIEEDVNKSNNSESQFMMYRVNGWIRGEDCLSVNVWTPSATQSASRKRPVLVYMHGGGFTQGMSNDLLYYDGENLARNHDAVVVTHNHRLNIFGYLNLAEFGDERYASSGNVGMLDILASLQWVRDNISNFGGDPANVLIYGQSGGGSKVSNLMAMPSAQGLFHGAVAQSGSALRSGSPEAATRMASAVLAELGISKTQLDKLSSVPTITLLDVQVAAQRRLQGGSTPDIRVGGWGPIVDGKILPAHPFDPGAPSISANIPMLMGTCLNEGPHGTNDKFTSEDLLKNMRARYKDKSEDIVAAYRKEYPKDSPWALWCAISGSSARLNAVTQAERKAALRAAPAYMYIYAWRSPVLGGRVGTFHTSEVPFVFDNAALLPHYSGGTAAAMELSSKMGAAWVGMARTGKPGHAGLPNWPAYEEKTRATMIFDSPCSVRNDPEGAGLRLIRQMT